MHPVTSLSSASCVILVAFRIVLVMSSHQHGCHGIFSVVTYRMKISGSSRTSPQSLFWAVSSNQVSAATCSVLS
ncbi:hypothetical protein D6D17_08583 [Aureobasidium pullulans]|uniref:Secreted protein n=1 Tax=Aureobasidium pullulans TaxID=5580 RepID=A0A4T0DH51_AURPU|nr:hypothetical protein D6D23_00985 [Aureobasidium pullulans]THW46251.1 hypothetical protein D6D21_03986 [Aureobasidium pullulans]THW91003.1 hypothetical protein D6D17_08583 [Aureobasidium pullulans]THX38819.1 hypothetical protein D6D10_04745 [Aureobasidium pullulans]TIA60461.1 hypothetical protein D6C76_10310 [Aureobasidium pullulans]